MFDLFGIRARRRAKREAAERNRLEALAEKKRIYQERKAKIDAFLDDYTTKLVRRSREVYERDKECAEKQNSKCPRCGSVNIVNHIRRTKGEVHGSGHSLTTSSSSHFLLGSSSHFSSMSVGRIDGELDTFPINKCNDCGHEWQIVKAEYQSLENEFSYFDSSGPYLLFRAIEGYFDLKYDPEDITDEFNSLEEKREDYCEKKGKNYVFDSYRTVPKYMLDYVLYVGIFCRTYDIDDVEGKEIWGLEDDCDKYSYQMPIEVWEICKKVIGWKGSEE